MTPSASSSEHESCFQSASQNVVSQFKHTEHKCNHERTIAKSPIELRWLCMELLFPFCTLATGFLKIRHAEPVKTSRKSHLFQHYTPNAIRSEPAIFQVRAQRKSFHSFWKKHVSAFCWYTNVPIILHYTFPGLHSSSFVDFQGPGT